MAKALRIPIERFEPNKPIRERLYLELPANKRMLLILHPDDYLEKDYISRMKAKGIRYFCFSAEVSDTRDPNTCEIYTLNSAGETKIEAEMASQNVTDPIPVQEIEAPSQENQNLAEPILHAEPEIPKKEAIAEDAEQTFAKGELTEEPEQRFTSNPPSPEPEQSFSADLNQPDETEQRFSNKQTKVEDELRFTNSEKEKEDELRFKSSPKAKEEEFLIKGGTNDQIDDEVVTLKAKSPTEDPFSKSRARTISQLKDYLFQGVPVDIPGSRENLLIDAKSQVASSKIAKRISILIEKQIQEKNENYKDEIQELEILLKKTTSGRMDEKLEPEVCSSPEFKEFEKQLNTEPTVVSNLVESIETIVNNKTLSTQTLSETYEMEKAKTSGDSQNLKDAPLTLTKLAAYLGSAIGYTNIDFLAELGFGVVLQFQQRRGTEVPLDKIPNFTKRALMESHGPSSVVDDYVNILKFLELYSSDPLVDLKEKEFSKKIFERTLEKTKNANHSPDPISLSQWVSFVEKGPSMDIHSLCSKASAKALKQAKEASIY